MSRMIALPDVGGAIREVTIPVTRMTRASCVRRVERAVRAEIIVPPVIGAGVPAQLVYRLASGDGRPLTDVAPSHEAWIHLLVLRDDLTGFQHLHPQPTGARGACGRSLQKGR